MNQLLVLAFCLLSVAQAWRPMVPTQLSAAIQNAAGISKAAVVSICAASLCVALTPAMADLTPASWTEGLQYEVLKSAPDAPQPKIGDLVAVRFLASYKGAVFDDTFKTDEPYYFRLGVGTVVKGLDETVVKMHAGERWHVKFGGELAFGSKGRPAAPGRPRIPPNADIDYEVELVEVPGYGDDVITDE